MAINIRSRRASRFRLINSQKEDVQGRDKHLACPGGNHLGQDIPMSLFNVFYPCFYLISASITVARANCYPRFTRSPKFRLDALFRFRPLNMKLKLDENLVGTNSDTARLAPHVMHPASRRAPHGLVDLMLLLFPSTCHPGVREVRSRCA